MRRILLAVGGIVVMGLTDAGTALVFSIVGGLVLLAIGRSSDMRKGGK